MPATSTIGCTRRVAHPEHPAQKRPAPRQAGTAADLDDLRSGMMPRQRSRASSTITGKSSRRRPGICRRIAKSCRFPAAFRPHAGRASAPPPDRVNVLDHPPSDEALERMPEPSADAVHAAQARIMRRTEATERLQKARQVGGRCTIL